MELQMKAKKSLFFGVPDFYLWIVGFFAATVFLVSFDKNKFLSSDAPMHERFFRSLRIPSLNLGIDLQGGVRLVYSVDVDKAVENRLSEYGKRIDAVLKKVKKVSKPVQKNLSAAGIEYSFKSVDDANAFANLIKEQVKELAVVVEASVVKVVLSPTEEKELRSTSVDQTIGVLRARLDNFSVRGLSIFKHGSHSLVIQLPGVSSADDVKATITKTARLEFKSVERQGRTQEELLDAYDGVIPVDRMMVPSFSDLLGGENDSPVGWCLVSVFPDLTGDRIDSARLDHGEDGRPCIAFGLNMQGARELREFSRDNIGKDVAIIIDNRVISVVRIQGELGANNRITGNFTLDHIAKFSLLLKSGALLAPLKMEQESVVGAELGEDALRMGLFACLLSMFMLFVFGLFYYGYAGLLAFSALVYNFLLTLTMLSAFNATLTLPGIVGMVLGVGMAIDSSVLIYERIKELLASGVTFNDAVTRGFSGALKVIFESSGATMLTALILLKFGSPSIKGFAVTLIIGIISTMLSGVLFLKSAFTYLVDKRDSCWIRF
ncbi:protein translocase subunit SecD [Candidatus Dependentiae bacterium]|nr:protein translocase subunit SecD [Candidatus Dependentiae bacterium]